LSFFDEADEPQTRERPAVRRRPPSRGGRRPPTDQQAIRTRRAIAAVIALIVVILLILGIHSCQVSARNSALKDYNNSVSSLIQQSDETGSQLFQEMSGTGGANNATGLQQQINETATRAGTQLKSAEGLSVPGQAKDSQANLVLALQMRHDGIVNIAQQIGPALGTTTTKDAVSEIAAEMARLYSSDVVYKDYALPELRSALSSALGSNNGEQQNTGQFVPSLSWLTPDYVASKLGATLPSVAAVTCSSNKIYGHSLDSVSVNGTTLNSGGNTIPASPAPTFTLNYDNGGDSNETNVKFKVTVTGTSVSGQKTVPTTTAHTTGSAQVSLSKAPAPGTYSVVATVVGVPCEKNTNNNSMTFPVTFQ
jgi:hypothetical protein